MYSYSSVGKCHHFHTRFNCFVSITYEDGSGLITQLVIINFPILWINGLTV